MSRTMPMAAEKCPPLFLSKTSSAQSATITCVADRPPLPGMRYPFDPALLLAMHQGRLPPRGHGGFSKTCTYIREAYVHAGDVMQPGSTIGSSACLRCWCGRLADWTGNGRGRPAGLIDVSDLGQTVQSIAIPTGGSLVFLIPAWRCMWLCVGRPILEGTAERSRRRHAYRLLSCFLLDA